MFWLSLCMLLTHAISSEIKQALGAVVSYATIILFGSHACGSHHIHSDYDILVVTKTGFSPSQKLPLKTSIRKRLLELGLPSYILTQSESELKTKSQLPGHIIKTILSEGVPL